MSLSAPDPEDSAEEFSDHPDAGVKFLDVLFTGAEPWVHHNFFSSVVIRPPQKKCLSGAALCAPKDPVSHEGGQVELEISERGNNLRCRFERVKTEKGKGPPQQINGKMIKATDLGSTLVYRDTVGKKAFRKKKNSNGGKNLI